MYSTTNNFASTTSAKVALPSVKVSLTIPNNNSSSSSSNFNNSNNRRVLSANEHGYQAVANSLEALQKSIDRQKNQRNNNQQVSSTPTSSLFYSRIDNNLQNNRPLSSSSSTNNNRNATKSHIRRNLEARAAHDLQHVNSEASGSFTNNNNADPLDLEDNNNNNNNMNKLQRQFVNFQLSNSVDRALNSNNNNHNNVGGGGYSAFQAALETALRKLEKKKEDVPMEERWSLLADCLTSLDLKQDLHRVCKDIQVVIEEIHKANAYEAAQHNLLLQQQQQQHQQQNNNNNNVSPGGVAVGTQDSNNSASFSLGSTLSAAQARKSRQAKARLNGTQTAMAAMMLEQCLNAVSDAAPYAKPAITWVLDTILGSIYVSYDIVRSDLSRSFEKLKLIDPNNNNTNNTSTTPNAEKLIARFYSKTFFQSVRALSTAARENAEHAEEIERSKTRQSRVLERAIAYWARYSMRRVLGAWRGFAKNEKIERDLRNQIATLGREKQTLKDLSEQRERDLSAIGGAANVALLGSSAESLQLQVRELQRALDFERRRATRAEAALALRVVAEANGEGNSNNNGGGNSNTNESGDGASTSAEVTSLRAEVAHYRAVAVEACRLGDIDLHELQRAVTAQTNVLARGMY